MTTTADLIHQTRGYLMSGQSDTLNVLDATIDADDTTISFRYTPKLVGEGVRVGCELEEFHVFETSGSGAGAAATVLRAHNGTTAVAHTAGAVLRCSPHFTDFEVLRAVNGCLADLSALGLFRISTDDFEYQPQTMGYALDVTGLINIWRVRYDTPGPETDWPALPASSWRLDQAADTGDFSTGVQLVIKAGGYPGHNVRVSYRRTFGTLSALADDVAATAGLHTEAHDIVPMGAAIRLMSGRDLKRSFLESQPDPRMADEVPPGAAQQSMRPLLQMFEDRVNHEAKRLMRKYPEQV